MSIYMYKYMSMYTVYAFGLSFIYVLFTCINTIFTCKPTLILYIYLNLKRKYFTILQGVDNSHTDLDLMLLLERHLRGNIVIGMKRDRSCKEAHILLLDRS